ncbi:PAS domain S-box protein [Nitrospira lenta]|uniref:Sensor protein FixL n=1 Tax=Nitrospira lenta TaxID=1436998 RepID=A0A330LCC9_9BACT|nr:PAS domain S-box protein [Nitrospira lenta]SPP64669.1 hypothetical protein NITLEN_20309 [Nitrospira lenta]
MAFYRQWHTVASQGTFGLVVAVIGAGLLGLSGVWMVEQELVARGGESLALGATEVAGKLDAMLRERDGDIELLATAPQVRGSDAARIVEHLRAVQRAYPVYARLAVADRTGRVIASTDQAWIGRDVRDASWFQAVWHIPRVYAETVKKTSQAMARGQLQSVVFSAPIHGDLGAFHGVIMSEVDAGLWNQLVEETVKQFASQTQNFGTVRYRILDADGNLLLTLDDRDNLAINLRELGLPSAVKVATSRPGYVEETHRIRNVPVVTGYARMQGVRSLATLQWGVLVRADRANMLASIRNLLAKIVLVGTAGFVLMLGPIVWVKHSQHREQEKAARAQRLLRDRDAQLGAVVTHAIDGIISIDQAGCILSFNPAAEKLFGYSADEAMGRNVSMLMPEPYRSEHDGYLSAFLHTGVAKVIGQGREVVGRRRDGSIFPMDLGVSEMELDGQRCFTGIVRDITARKAAERNVQESEMRLRAVINGAMDAIVTMDEAGRICGWNPRAEEVFGWSERDAVGRDLAELIVPPSLREAHRVGLANYLATNAGPRLNQQVEITAIRRTAEEFPVELFIIPVKLEHTVLFSAFIRDISARKAMLKQLEEGAVYFRMLSELLPLSLFELNHEGQCVYRNRALDQLLEQGGVWPAGASPNLSWREWVCHEDRRQIDDAWAGLREGMVPISEECRLAAAGSALCWVQVSVWPLETDHGVRYLAVMEDITDRKRTAAHTMRLLRQGQFELRTATEAKHLAELLAYAYPDPSRTQLGLVELLVNGVEHGNLGISYQEKTALLEEGRLDDEVARRLALPIHASKRVRVAMDRSEKELRISIVDDGEGFDWAKYLNLDLANLVDSHGRGIAISKSLSFDRLEYRGCGNQVVAWTHLDHPGTDSDGRSEQAA